MSTNVSEIDPDAVFCICQDIYKAYGINLQFPKARDVKKTYQYRYLVAICKKFLAWNLDLPEIKRFLAIAIGNSFKHKTIKKGLSALHQKNLLQISYEQLISYDNTMSQTEKVTNAALDFIRSYCSNGDPRALLTRRENIRSNMVLTSLYQAGKINVEFLSINDLCRTITMEAISRDMQDKMFLPTLGKIYSINSNLSSNKDNFLNFLIIKKWGS